MAESSALLSSTECEHRQSQTEGQCQKGDEEHQKMKEVADDGVFNYACRLLSYGLLSRNFQDATKDGDEKRICRLWKFLMLHFKTNGRLEPNMH